ncbi:flagellar filament capping protein FliD, partial [Oceanospirillum sp. HFRX-1_2]
MNFLGIGSGLDLSSMLEGLVQVASEPKVQQLGRREIQLEDSISGLGILKSKLSEFQDAADALKDGDFFTKMTPTLTQPASGDLIKVEASDSAVASNYDIEVVALAQGSKATSAWRSEKYQSDFFADTSSALSKSGTLTIGGENIAVAAGDSLKDIAESINTNTALQTANISAAVVDGRLEYYQDGLGGTVTATTSDADLDVFATSGANAGMTLRADSSKDTGLAGRLTFEADGKTFSVDIDPTKTKSLDDVVSAINSADDNFGVTANIIDGKLVYQSSVTGAGNDLSVTSSNGEDTDGNPITASANLDSLTTGAGNVVIGTDAADAEIKVDGVSITNDSNTFDGAVSGLTITALKQSKDAGTADAETAGVSVGSNNAAVQKKIETFMSTYNALRTTMSELKGTVDEDGNFTAGKLSNDPIVRNVESVLNSVITTVASEADGDRNTLFSIGIEITEDGTLSKSNTDTKAGERWDAAMSGSMEKLKKLFAGDGTNMASDKGIADLASAAVENFVSFTGVIKGQEDSLQEQLDALDEQYEAHARYIESYEKTLKMQFTALDATMARMNSVMQYITP